MLNKCLLIITVIVKTSPSAYYRLEQCVCARAQSLSCVRLLETPWTVACKAPLSIDFSGRNIGVGCHYSPMGSSQPRD